jgi:hypothetical protein
MAGLTADSILTAVRDFAGAGSAEEDGAAARLLRLVNREQELRLTALLAKTKGSHRKATLDYTVTTATTYAIPTRAIAAGITQVEAVDASGNVWMLYEFPDDQRSKGWPRNGHFYFQGNNLVFYAVPPAGTLRVTYNRRLSELVLAASARAITAINTGTKTVTIAAAPTTFTGLTAMDLVQTLPHFDILGMDSACTAIGAAGTSVIFSATLPATLAVGDYVCIPGQTVYCQAPLEMHQVLAQMAVVKWLEGKGDPRLGEARGTLKELAAEALTLLEPRSEQGDDILLNPHAPGWASRRWLWRGSSGT